MRILLCDDDLLILEQLRKLLTSYFEAVHVKCPEIVSYTCGVDLLGDTGAKDIVFLDIEMPGMNGVYIGNELRHQNRNTLIIVITSYSEYLDDAMRFHVFRYLSKPLDKRRFFRNLKEALACCNTLTRKIPIETREGLCTVPASYIIAIEAQERKVIVHTIKGRLLSVHKMSYWIKELPPNSFFQTHRSFIINFEHVTDFDHSTIRMYNNTITAYLTRRKYTEFKNAYLLYLESMR